MELTALFEQVSGSAAYKEVSWRGYLGKACADPVVQGPAWRGRVRSMSRAPQVAPFGRSTWQEYERTEQERVTAEERLAAAHAARKAILHGTWPGMCVFRRSVFWLCNPIGSLAGDGPPAWPFPCAEKKQKKEEKDEAEEAMRLQKELVRVAFWSWGLDVPGTAVAAPTEFWLCS